MIPDDSKESGAIIFTIKDEGTVILKNIRIRIHLTFQGMTTFCGRDFLKITSQLNIHILLQLNRRQQTGFLSRLNVLVISHGISTHCPLAPTRLPVCIHTNTDFKCAGTSFNCMLQKVFVHCAVLVRLKVQVKQIFFFCDLLFIGFMM